MGIKTAAGLLLSTTLWVNMGLTGSFLCWSCLESLMQMQPDVSWDWNVQDGCIHVAGILAERAARLGPPYSMFPLHVASLYGSWSQEQAFQEDKSLRANSYQGFACIMPTHHHFPKLRFSAGGDNELKAVNTGRRGAFRTTEATARLTIKSTAAAPKASTLPFPLQEL